MKVAGIIIAKNKSKRFPGKNYYNIDGKPMFYNNVELLQKTKEVDDVYVATDSDIIKDYCKKKNIKIINRPINISYDDQPYFDVLRYAYFCIEKRYDVIVTILANTVGHTVAPISRGLLKLQYDEDIKEIRSFDEYGNQSGILMFREDMLLNTYSISNHMHSIRSDGREIHYVEEIN